MREDAKQKAGQASGKSAPRKASTLIQSDQDFTTVRSDGDEITAVRELNDEADEIMEKKNDPTMGASFLVSAVVLMHVQCSVPLLLGVGQIWEIVACRYL